MTNGDHSGLGVVPSLGNLGASSLLARRARAATELSGCPAGAPATTDDAGPPIVTARPLLYVTVNKYAKLQFPLIGIL